MAQFAPQPYGLSDEQEYLQAYEDLELADKITHVHSEAMACGAEFKLTAVVLTLVFPLHKGTQIAITKSPELLSM
ncbi:hypothetical protein NQZ68_002771 [Dissostichus eleginoides]|nr:hypothetical protein NQZ68_002771 [Dissostichus eleginoides]